MPTGTKPKPTKVESIDVHVFDTYVKANDWHTMHFDVCATTNDEKKAIQYAKDWLNSIGEGKAKVTTKECSYCHTSVRDPSTMPQDRLNDLKTKGHYIIKMMGCPE